MRGRINKGRAAFRQSRPDATFPGRPGWERSRPAGRIAANGWQASPPGCRRAFKPGLGPAWRLRQLWTAPIVLDPPRRNSPAKTKRLIVKNNELQWPGSFACKDNDMHRQDPQITMNIHADNQRAGLPSVGATLRSPRRATAPEASNKSAAWFPARKSGLPDLRTIHADLGQARDQGAIGAIREFQFAECTDLAGRVKRSPVVPPRGNLRS
jgi:hypothetical protein